MQTKGKLKLMAQYAVSTAYLRPTQIYNRLRLVLRQRVLHENSTFRSWYLRQATGDEPFNPIVFPMKTPAVSADIDAISENTFTFLNRTVQQGDTVDWRISSETRLWLYNLHYFDYALDLAREFNQSGSDRAYRVFRRLVREWIDHCPVATPLIWDAYPTSLRVTNWVKAYATFLPALMKDSSFAKTLRRSLYIQTAFLERHLEYHLLNNHLLENARTLLIAGSFFQDRTAERWRRKGQQILWKGLDANFLNDGGHDERSPMYHQIMLDLYDDVATVLEAAGEVVPAVLSEKLQAMRQWLSDMLHPDGHIPLLNDSAFSIARNAQDCIYGTNEAKDGLTPLPDSGYFVFRDKARRHCLVFDAGPLGADHQTAHSHCDTLAYELSLDGQRMIVDSGVAGYYGDIELRTYYRSTRAHNTVVVDGQEQSEIWDRFRVARRARPMNVVWSDPSDDSLVDYAIGSHSGYRRLRGNVIHRRWVCWVDRRFWVICDQLTGRGEHRIESLIHFHPDVNISVVPDQSQPGQVQLGDAVLQVVPWRFRHVSTHHGNREPLQGWYAPEFGLNLKNHVWGLSETAKLPLWCGYLLWPERTETAVCFTRTDRQSGRLNVQASDAHYQIMIEPCNVTAEKTE